MVHNEFRAVFKRNVKNVGQKPLEFFFLIFFFFFFSLVVFITDANAHMLTQDTYAIKSSDTAATAVTKTAIDHRIFAKMYTKQNNNNKNKFK